MLDPELKTSIDSLSGSLDGFSTRITNIQTQMDAIDRRITAGDRAMGGGFHLPSAETKAAYDSSNLQNLIDHKRGTGTILFKDAAYSYERKQTTEIGAGFMTTGVMGIDRIAGIVPEARQALTVRDALYARPTTMAIVDFVKVSQPLTIASPVPEASAKPQNQLNFSSVSEKVRTIATWLPASKQILDDMTELMSFIQSSLPYYVNLEEELQLLSGDGTGENLHGLIVQAAPFNASLLPSSGATKIDAIGAAIAQITVAKELQPTFAIIHPADWWSIRLAKDSLGRYIIGDPQSSVAARLFDLLVIPTTSMTQGQFLVGSGNPAASEIRDRMEMQVEVSTEHMDYFIKNLLAIRAEIRLALVVKRPNSYVQGTFGALPASGYAGSYGSSPLQ